MIDPTLGSKEERKRLTDTVNNLLFKFPLASMTILGKSVHVGVDPLAPCPGYAGTGGFRISSEALRPFNGDEKDTWSDRALMFLVLHEWMHVFGNHHKRGFGKHHELWNIAIDYRVNADCIRILSWTGDVPHRGLNPPDWVGDRTPEEIYDELLKDPNSAPTGGGPDPAVLGPGDIVPEDLSDPSIKTEEELLDVFIMELSRAQVSMENLGKDMEKLCGPSILERLVKIKKGKVPWERLILGRILNSFGTTCWTYAPPNKRTYPRIVLPSYRSTSSRKLIIAIDISGSIQGHLLDRFGAEIAPAAARAKLIEVVTFDQIVRERIVTKKPREAFSKLKFATGAHSTTDVRPVFKIVDEVKPSSIVVFTDGLIHLPEKEYPQTLWVLPQKGRRLPWGRNYEMDVSW